LQESVIVNKIQPIRKFSSPPNMNEVEDFFDSNFQTIFDLDDLDEFILQQESIINNKKDFSEEINIKSKIDNSFDLIHEMEKNIEKVEFLNKEISKLQTFKEIQNCIDIRNKIEQDL
jgi:hypothetical protein